MSLVRLYGRLLTQSSLSVVTAGFKAALDETGLLAGVYGIDTQHIEELASLDGSNAFHGVYTGPLDRIGEMFEAGRHEHYWVMVAPNSDRLPETLVRQLKGYKEKYGQRLHLMAPSVWAARQVAKFFTREAILYAHHGVSEEYCPQPEISEDVRRRYADGEFRVLHFSTSAQARKGTFELIQAWTTVRKQQEFKKAQLLCILDYPAKMALLERLDDEGIHLGESVLLNDRADLPPTHLARVLASAHLVCQPSRGEAFGLIPLQALCCGVPVAATICTGHSAYLEGGSPPTPGLVGIRTGALSPLDDIPGSLAPSLDPDDIVLALRVGWIALGDLQARALKNAEALRKQWSWSNQLSFFENELRSFHSTPPSP